MSVCKWYSTSICLRVHYYHIYDDVVAYVVASERPTPRLSTGAVRAREKSSTAIALTDLISGLLFRMSIWEPIKVHCNQLSTPINDYVSYFNVKKGSSKQRIRWQMSDDKRWNKKRKFNWSAYMAHLFIIITSSHAISFLRLIYIYLEQKCEVKVEDKAEYVHLHFNLQDWSVFFTTSIWSVILAAVPHPYTGCSWWHYRVRFVR